MNVLSELSDVAAVLGEPARVAMLWNLLDGQTRPAGELAFFANVSPQSASMHLAKLVEAGMLTVKIEGRYRCYAIARPEVAHAVESMAALIPSAGKGETLLHRRRPDFCVARTCYDHLAGKLAVRITDALQERGIITADAKDFVVTETGAGWLVDFGIDIEALKRERRALARKCLDWSERRYHLAGALGAGLLEELLVRKWLIRKPDERTINVTLEGRKNLDKKFGIRL